MVNLVPRIRTSNWKRWLLALTLIALLSPLASLGLNSVWAQDGSTASVTVDIVGADLVAKGAGALVTLNLTCTGFLSIDYSEASATIRQRVGGGQITEGSGGASVPNLVCDGSPQSATVIVSPHNYYGEATAFKKGEAIVFGRIHVCGTITSGEYPMGECRNASDNDIIRIR
jgi:hypothetical protein